MIYYYDYKHSQAASIIDGKKQQKKKSDKTHRITYMQLPERVSLRGGKLKWLPCYWVMS